METGMIICLQEMRMRMIHPSLITSYPNLRARDCL
jgi:hypothetical protein